jgi:SAM-dependent methyltransferase
MNTKDYGNQGSATLESMSQAKWYNKWVIKKFEQYLRGDILEVGCGIGSFTLELLKYGKVWAIDIDEDFVKNNKIFDQKLHIGFGDIEQGKYFFGNRRFDSIVCLNVLEHIENDKTALMNLYSLLKVGGDLIIIVPSHQSLYGEIDKAIGHFRRYDKNKFMNEIHKAGFKVKYSRRLNLLGSIGWFVAGRMLKYKSIKKSNIKIFNLFAPIFLKLERFVEPAIGTSILFIASK